MRFQLGLMAMAFAGAAFAADYKLTGENTKIEWTGTKKDGKHSGGFKKVTGTCTCDGDPTKAKLEVTIDTDSIYSDNDGLTAHLKNKDFFDVKTNPTAAFKATKLEKDGEKYKVTGDFTLCGKTKSISFPAVIAEKDGAMTLTAEFKINRNDYGMSYGAGKIDEEVALKVSVTAKK
ncbi:MAG: YceI family protein [Fimbriiglobus sp.]|jgi:polyisoprenoid-binding protein YceI|nr:YceI family protein [Fimbriiglobus sp.]